MNQAASWPAVTFVHPDKIAKYLLDPGSDDGAAKCAYLTSYGFTAEDPFELARALEEHVCESNFERIEESDWGRKFIFDGPLPAPNGRDATVVTVWMQDPCEPHIMKFVTSRPSRR